MRRAFEKTASVFVVSRFVTNMAVTHSLPGWFGFLDEYRDRIPLPPEFKTIQKAHLDELQLLFAEVWKPFRDLFKTFRESIHDLGGTPTPSDHKSK